MSKGHAIAIIGGQYGSEGKGRICQSLADEYPIHVRVANSEYAHTIINPHGQREELFILPSVAYDQKCGLIVGIGSIIKPDLLLDEILRVEATDPQLPLRLSIDANCPIMSGLPASEIRIHQIKRNAGFSPHLRDVLHRPEYASLIPYVVNDTQGLIAKQLDMGRNVLLEGWSGSASSLTHGDWPHVNSHDTNAAQLAADVGMPPRMVKRTVLVVRTLPVRPHLGGGSLKNELSWSELVRRGIDIAYDAYEAYAGFRVGEWDDALIERAVLLNAPTSLAVTYLDYLSPDDRGKTSAESLSDRSRRFLVYVRSRFGLPVSMASTGGPNLEVLRLTKLV